MNEDSHLNLPVRIHLSENEMYLWGAGWTNPEWMFPIGYKHDPYKPMKTLKFKKGFNKRTPEIVNDELMEANRMYLMKSEPIVCFSNPPMKAMVQEISETGRIIGETILGDQSKTCHQCGRLWSEHR